MQIRVLLTCFGLTVALLNAQNIVTNGVGENRVESVSSATPIRVAEANSATLDRKSVV